MPKKNTTPPVGPQYISYRKVPESLGGTGRVCLYDSQGGLPETATEIPAALLKKLRWVLVHFPSRRTTGVKTKAAGLKILSEIHKGTDSLQILPPVEKREKRTRKQKPVSKGPTPAPAPATPEPVGEPSKAPAPAGAGEGDSEGLEDDFKPTEVPAGSTFDAAMQHVFPVQRITENLERLLVASVPIYSREGTYLGEEPQYNVRMQSLRTLIEYHQGRPNEKKEAPQEKKRMGYDELVEWLKGSPDACEYMEKICRDAREVQKAKAEAQAQPQKPTAAPSPAP